MVSPVRKEASKIATEILDEMSEKQLKSFTTFAKSISFGEESKEDDEDEEGTESGEDEEEEDDEDEKKSKKGKKKKPKDEDEEEEDDEEGEGDEEEGDEEDEESGDDDENGEEESEEIDYAEMSEKALRTLAAEREMKVKSLLKESTNPKKTLVKAHKLYDERKETLEKKSLDKLKAIVEKYEVEYAKPRGKASDETKKKAIVKAILSAGVKI